MRVKRNRSWFGASASLLTKAESLERLERRRRDLFERYVETANRPQRLTQPNAQPRDDVTQRVQHMLAAIRVRLVARDRLARSTLAHMDRHDIMASKRCDRPPD